MNSKRTNSRKPLLRYFVYALVVLLLLAGVVTYKGWQIVFGSNVHLPQGKSYTYVYIKTGSTYDGVLKQLSDEGVITNSLTFDWVAQLMKYPEKVRAGKYKVVHGWSNKKLLSILRSGEQEEVKVVLRGYTDLATTSGIIGRQLEADSVELLHMLNSPEVQNSLGFDEDNIIGLVIPDTYSFYWNTSAAKVLERLNSEYEKFWNAERKQKAGKLNLSPQQVSALASIVAKETVKNDEMPVVAGVYLNRLKKGMLLQADPTVIFAAKDPTIRRVTNALLNLDSPYNTYRYKGLTPGPICIPPVMAIDAVLNARQHNYIYFCAKEDFSGYHNFAETLEQHNVNARLYQRELNKRKIYR
ncbi:MAG: endolytic transglycosylase MltG [Bacteroidia bacterium]|nr:endolytic transglycosylase MltG [Bacteroidia bacterium]MBP7260880.1 endolytic transglycosylase MltG [Bacteroidia bacterium]MBP9180717.1 endolytic transglycosylase MltG [Bacteroidia bacterium]MBP9723419.1 endolytic transglycosylase MltG [Bacteroidia bacterium]